MDDDDDEYLEGHAEQQRREQRGGEAGVAGEVVHRNAEAHFRRKRSSRSAMRYYYTSGSWVFTVLKQTRKSTHFAILTSPQRSLYANVAITGTI